jgi:hypothetical protein
MAHGWASIDNQILGNASSAGARRRRRGLAKRRGPGPRGAHSEWHGRVNAGQGAVMTVQGVGAALSPAIGGWLAQDLGYPAAFMDPWMLCHRLNRNLAFVRLRAQTSMRGEANW